MLSITFIYPSNGSHLSGGLKVLCEYANRLVFDGHKVNIVYAGSIFWAKKSNFHKLTNIVRYLQTYCKGYSCRSWFSLDSRVKEHYALSLNYRHIPKSDIYISTSPCTNAIATMRKLPRILLHQHIFPIYSLF